jgi:hypothetical protein
MLEHADQLLAGEALPTTPWAETRSSLGQQRVVVLRVLWAG